MPFEPDIIVTSPDGSEVSFVAETKMSVRSLEETEGQLMRFMVGMGCPVGLLVTPRTLFLYLNEYLASPGDSVRRVAKFDTGNILNFEPSRSGRRDEYAFEELVQNWIERLRSESEVQRLPEDLKRMVQDYVLPAISQGVVRAGHPRPSFVAG